MIKQFADAFKEVLTPEDRLDIEPVKIQLVDHHESIIPYNVKVPIDATHYLESTARKELKRILTNGALEEVHHTTPSSCSRPSLFRSQAVRLVTYLKNMNQFLEMVGYHMNSTSHRYPRYPMQKKAGIFFL